MAGPLDGLRVLELGGIGPGPFAGMLLADLGAEVIRLDPPPVAGGRVDFPILFRNRRSVTLDLKAPEGAELALSLGEGVDAVIEGFRPGVAERLGVGPQDVLARNPRVAYGRMTGWGQEGPLAHEPGHDLNYIAVAGVLNSIGPAGDPVVPLNLAGDMGGGGMLLAMGLLAAVMSARDTGRGQVVDAAMVDGAATLFSMVLDFRNEGRWSDGRASNPIDGGSPCYSIYRCADGLHLAVGIGEHRSYLILLDRLGLRDHGDFVDRTARANWASMREVLEDTFATRTRDEWETVFEGSGACVTGVLSLEEAVDHPHNRSRGTLRRDAGGRIEQAPAPRFSATPAAPPRHVGAIGDDTRTVLASVGVSTERIADLHARGIIG